MHAGRHLTSSWPLCRVCPRAVVGPVALVMQMGMTRETRSDRVWCCCWLCWWSCWWSCGGGDDDGGGCGGGGSGLRLLLLPRFLVSLPCLILLELLFLLLLLFPLLLLFLLPFLLDYVGNYSPISRISADFFTVSQRVHDCIQNAVFTFLNPPLPPLPPRPLPHSRKQCPCMITYMSSS